MNKENNLPNFSQIKPAEIEPTVTKILNENRTEIKKLLEQPAFTWENLMQPMDDLDNKLKSYWSLIGHLNAVVNSPELRDAYNKCLPKLTEYATEMGQN